MFLPKPNPIAFTAFGLPIRWYGVLISVGILIGLTIAYRRAPLHQIHSERVLDLTLISLPLGIIGARLYYVIFNWNYYEGDILSVINLRSGGLAIHGGLLLGLSVAAVCCKLWNIKPLNLLDLMVPSIAIAQSIGRWGNYFNQEAHGGPTDLPWAIEINGEMVHPTFLYESIWCLILFFVLIFIDNRRSFNGQTFLLYGILYSFERFFVEGLRTDSLMIGSLKMAQLISAIIFSIFLVVFIVMWRKYKRKKNLYSKL
ncbi:MAG: prolipoprotein diacylglyceryl transferase [Anaerovoracaceae bacterium]